MDDATCFEVGMLNDNLIFFIALIFMNTAINYHAQTLQTQQPT